MVLKQIVLKQIVLKQVVFALIKVVSTVLMSGAIVLETWNLTLGVDWAALPGWCHVGFWYVRVAASIHLLEGVAAGIWASRRSDHQPLLYGLYTFFVGTVGLQELWESREKTAQT